MVGEPGVAAEIEEEETADDLDWLGGAAVATAQDELPDWLGTPATAEATTETDLDDLAGWLNEPAAEIEEEEAADGRWPRLVGHTCNGRSNI
ncbi:MAG: hypothetical protein IPL28_08030 [Chloroflexi bacterium]|nr:hypothetical protein [Chloroflexota bacterium]